jgi:hypothetical protein
MADLVNASAQAIADALAPTPQAPAARWRWGSVVSVNADGTMNVSIGGATVPSVRCAQHVMGAQVGDRVRVLYCGTEAMVDAVRASSALMSVPSPSMDASTRSAWLDALGIARGVKVATVTTGSAWSGWYYANVTIDIPEQAGTDYTFTATAHLAGNLLGCAINLKTTTSVTVFVICPRSLSDASVEVDWMLVA